MNSLSAVARVVFVFSLMVVLYAIFRSQPPAEIFHESDKAGHILAFLALGISGRLGFPRLSEGLFWGALVVAAPLLEGLQPMLRPLRIFSVEDMLANLLGVLLAWLIVRRIRRRIENL